MSQGLHIRLNSFMHYFLFHNNLHFLTQFLMLLPIASPSFCVCIWCNSLPDKWLHFIIHSLITIYFSFTRYLSHATHFSLALIRTLISNKTSSTLLVTLPYYSLSYSIIFLVTFISWLFQQFSLSDVMYLSWSPLVVLCYQWPWRCYTHFRLDNDQAVFI